MLDTEWGQLQRAFSQWLSRSNFDKHGMQRTRLSELTQPIIKRRS